LHSSLCPFGFLALGMKESMNFTNHESSYDGFDLHHKIYRRSDRMCMRSSSSGHRWAG
jgi:hypothetical protein